MTTHAVMVIEFIIDLAGAIPGIKIKLIVESRDPLKIDRNLTVHFSIDSRVLP